LARNHEHLNNKTEDFVIN